MQPWILTEQFWKHNGVSSSSSVRSQLTSVLASLCKDASSLLNLANIEYSKNIPWSYVFDEYV